MAGGGLPNMAGGLPNMADGLVVASMSARANNVSLVLPLRLLDPDGDTDECATPLTWRTCPPTRPFLIWHTPCGCST
eukprot:6279592-Prymnesium_polylepis.1